MISESSTGMIINILGYCSRFEKIRKWNTVIAGGGPLTNLWPRGVDVFVSGNDPEHR